MPKGSLQKSLASDQGLLADFTAVPATWVRARWPGRGLGFPGRCWLGAGAVQVQPEVGGCFHVCTDVEPHPAPPGAIGGCSPAAAFGPGCGGAHPPSGQHRGKPGCCIVRGCTDMQRGKNIIIYSIYSARHGQEQSSSSTSGATAKAGQQPGRVPTDGKKSAPWSQKKQQKSGLQNSH